MHRTGGLSDQAQLRFAAEHHRAVLTHNRIDFELLHRVALDKQEPHAGIIIANRRGPHADLRAANYETPQLLHRRRDQKSTPVPLTTIRILRCHRLLTQTVAPPWPGPSGCKWGRILCCACQLRKAEAHLGLCMPGVFSEISASESWQQESSHTKRCLACVLTYWHTLTGLADVKWPVAATQVQQSIRLAPLAMTMQANGQRESGEILCLERLINPQNSLLGQQEGDAVGQVGHAESVQAEKGTGRFSREAKSHTASIGRRPRERGVDSNLSLAGDFIGCGVSCVNHGLRVDQHVGLYGNEPLCSL